MTDLPTDAMEVCHDCACHGIDPLKATLKAIRCNWRVVAEIRHETLNTMAIQIDMQRAEIDRLRNRLDVLGDNHADDAAKAYFARLRRAFGDTQ